MNPLQTIFRKLSALDRCFVLLLLLLGLLQFASIQSTWLFVARSVLATLVVLLGLVVGFRYLVLVIRATTWRLRNRLILTYVFIGVVPVMLICAMLGIGLYVLMGQMATYMLAREITRRNEIVHDFAYAVAWHVASHSQTRKAIEDSEQFLKQLQPRTPDLQVIVRLKGGMFSVPADAALHEFPPWSRVGFVGIIRSGLDYAIAAHIKIAQDDEDIEVFAYEPTTPSLLSQLLPNLALVSFRELEDDSSDISPDRKAKPAQTVRFSRPNKLEAPWNSFSLPTSRGWWDIEVRWGTPLPVYLWEGNSGSETRVLVSVLSRPSLIISQLFSTLGSLAGSLRLLLYVIGILLLLVEIASFILGVGLTRTITRSVADLYSGTLRINAGDFSKRIPLRTKDQLNELAASFNRMTASVEKLIAESKEKERLESELEIAREVQSQLFPKEFPKLRTLEVIGLCQPARMVSGDYYDFVRLNSEWTALAIGDIAGKGISAALLMASIQSSLRAQLGFRQAWTSDRNRELQSPVSTSDLAELLNQQLYESTSAEKFATFFLGLYHEPTSRLIYTNAGHLPPVLLKSDGPRLLEVNGMVLGAFPDQQYEFGSLELKPGEILYAYTDGIVEPENEYGEEFGEDRLLTLFVENSRKPLEEIAAKVTRSVLDWSSAAEQPDDMTLIIVRRL